MFNTQIFYKLLKKGDYEIIGQAYPVAAIVGSLGYFLFYFSDKALGMYENFYLRIIVAVLFLQLVHIKKNFNTLKIFVAEIILALCLPLFYSYFYFCTNQHINWAAGFFFCGFTYGFLTGRVKYTLSVYPLFIIIGFFLYDRYFMNATMQQFFSSIDIILLSIFTAFFSSIMKLILECVLLTHITIESRQKQLIKDEQVKDSTDYNLSLQKDLRKVKKLDAVGKLIGGLMEDFDEMIEIIFKKSMDLKHCYTTGDKIKRIDTVLDIAEKSSKLIKSMAVFSPNRYEQLWYVNIHNVLNDVIKMLSESFGKNIVLEPKFSAVNAGIYGNAEMLEQAFFNICINAFQAMPDGGKLIIGTENLYNPNKNKQDNIENTQIRISFRDSGVGMDSVTKSNIFNPFYSTKGSGGGRGLGLVMVNETIKRHCGSISVESTPFEGTMFCISLPVRYY